MLAYRRYLIVKDPAKLELTGLPFLPGQRVEVVVVAEDEERLALVEKLRALFKTTQAIPQAQAISEEMIAEEVEQYRAGQ